MTSTSDHLEYSIWQCHIESDLQIILSLLGTRFIDPNSTAERGEQLVKIDAKMFNINQNQSKMSKSIKKVLELLSSACSCQKAWSIPSKSYCWSPVPRCHNNLQLCLVSTPEDYLWCTPYGSQYCRQSPLEEIPRPP